MLKPMRSLRLVLFSLAVLSSLVSCAVAPAGLERTRMLLKPDAKIDDQKLIRLLDTALDATQTEKANQALGTFVEAWRLTHREKTEAILIREGNPLSGTNYHVVFESDHLGSYLPSYFDEIHDATAYRVKKGVKRRRPTHPRSHPPSDRRMPPPAPAHPKLRVIAATKHPLRVLRPPLEPRPMPRGHPPRRSTPTGRLRSKDWTSSPRRSLLAPTSTPRLHRRNRARTTSQPVRCPLSSNR